MHKIWQHNYRLIFLGISMTLLIAAAGSWYAYSHRPLSPEQKDAKTLSSIKDFHLYTLADGKTDYTMTPGSISLSHGVLIFGMKNKTGSTLAFTEEATPSDYPISNLKADKIAAIEYGQMFITDAINRTTGALFTKDNTWILVNAPSPIGKDAMEHILTSLAPAK